MSEFRSTNPQKRFKLSSSSSSSRVSVSQPTSFEELPVEIIERILGFMDFPDRQRFRETSTRCRTVHDQFVEHRVMKLCRRSDGNSMNDSQEFLTTFCRLIFDTTLFFHPIALPQFMTMFVSNEDLLGNRTLHSSVVSKISTAKFIGDISEVFEKLMLQYLSVVQSGCKAQRNLFRLLLIITIINLLNNCQSATLKKRQRTKFYLQFEFWINGGWMGSLWPSNERKSMNLQILLVVLMEMDISMRLGQSFRKVTDFSECVTVYGTDVYTEETLKGPSTKFQFHINSEDPLIDVVDRLLNQGEKGDQDELVKRAMSVTAKRFFFELNVTCKEARKWGCAENYFVQK